MLQKINHCLCRKCFILEDFNVVSQSESECRGYLHKDQAVADYVGIPIKHSKTVQPVTCVTVHGIEVDNITMQARLSQDKLDNLAARLEFQAKEESGVDAITITYRSSQLRMQCCRAWSSLSTPTYESDYGDKQDK